MEFDISRVYTVVNADKLKVGSKVIVADTLEDLKYFVLNDENTKQNPKELLEICGEDCQYRFRIDKNSFALAYLVSEPEEKKLKWTDLKVGDILCNETESRMVTGIDTTNETDTDGNIYHICLCDSWLTDKELEDWEKENG